MANEIKKNSKVAKKIAKKGPISGQDRIKYNSRLSDASEGRISDRVHRDMARRLESGVTANNVRMAVTADNRPEVVKGSKASGVKVNNKMIRQGKVKAAESMVRKSKVKMAVKAIGNAAVGASRLAGPIGFIAQAPSMITATKKYDPPSSKKKGKTGRNK